jgi:hypothetical protein
MIFHRLLFPFYNTQRGYIRNKKARQLAPCGSKKNFSTSGKMLILELLRLRVRGREGWAEESVTRLIIQFDSHFISYYPLPILPLSCESFIDLIYLFYILLVML